MTNPYFFVSHKHADRDIALVLANFVRDVGHANVDIHLSSAPEFEGPRVGRDLNESLRDGLAKTQVLFLVFTDETQDWSYCMWECGVATDPNDATRTNVVVIQCGNQAPVVYGTLLRIDATSLESIETLVVQLCTSPEFIPHHGQPLTGYGVREPRLKELAQTLYDSLQEPIARHRRELAEQVTSPFVRIELPGERVKAIREAGPTEREDLAARCLLDDARIDTSLRADGLFNIAIGPTTTIARLAGIDDGRSPAATLPPWLQSVVRQVVAAIRQELMPVAWAPYEADGGRLHLPHVATYSIPGDDATCHFNVLFMRVRSPAILAGDRMLTMENVSSLRLSDAGAGDRLLTDVLAGDKSRIPIIDGEGKPRMIAHRSMIMEFIAAKSFTGADTAALTLADLLADDEMAAMFSSTFGTVGPEATLEEARQAMAQVPGCQDVFVTANGTRDAEVLGWLTNTMFVQA